MSKKQKSVEPQVAQHFNSQLINYNLKPALEQENLDGSLMQDGPIDKALKNYESKTGKNGGNRVDAKLLLTSKNKKYPIMIEYKGYKDKLVALDNNGNVENHDIKGTTINKNIKKFAVNGAVHYANAILHYTNYQEVIAVGITGYKETDLDTDLTYEIEAYLVTKENLGVGQKIGSYKDLSFLQKDYFDDFIEDAHTKTLSESQLHSIKIQKELEIDNTLSRINNDIYDNEIGLSENDRVYLIAAAVMINLGVDETETDTPVEPLDMNDLVSSYAKGRTDANLVMNKLEEFLEAKGLPDAKIKPIIRTFRNTIENEHINRIINGETQLKRILTKIINELGIYYKIDLTTDFTGKLFNEMYDWLGFSQDKENDVVLTPSYISNLLVKLARINKDSHVWDLATGSAGLLVSAMNEMLDDARSSITSPEILKQKELSIKVEQLLGLEILPNVYMLAILNMILMGDGSSNILNEDSMLFNGNYAFGNKKDQKFPADAFILNPPYSSDGKGMSFVKKGLSMMEKGYGSVIVQGSAGTGGATDYNKSILKTNSLLASIKMPANLFSGKASVQTYIYVFEIGKPHNSKQIVKFIDFSNDGYKRANRKKASLKIINQDNAKERYQEISDIINYSSSYRKLLPEKCYYESTINPNAGNDWNQEKPFHNTPTLDDFINAVDEYIMYKISSFMKGAI